MAPYRGARLAGSLAEASEVLAVCGEIARPGLELPGASSGHVQRALPPLRLLGHQVEAPANNLGFALPRRLFQPLQRRPVRSAEARVDVGFMG